MSNKDFKKILEDQIKGLNLRLESIELRIAANYASTHSVIEMLELRQERHDIKIKIKAYQKVLDMKEGE